MKSSHLLVVLALSACAPTPRPGSARTHTVTSGEALCAQVLARLERSSAACGCGAPSGALEVATERCRLLYELEGAVLEPGAVDACLAAIDAQLDGRCVEILVPRACDPAALTSGARPTAFVALGESCSYAVCEPGLACVGDEETACVAAPARSVALCDSPIALPRFLP